MIINLLNIVATMFTGSNTHITGGVSRCAIDFAYNFAVEDIDTVDETITYYNFEIVPIVDLASPYFEVGGSLTNESFNSLLFEFETENILLSNIDYLVFDIDIFNIYITCFTDPYSIIQLYFDYEVNFRVVYLDNTNYFDTFESYYEFDYTPNFTVLSVFDIIDETYIYEFYSTFDIDLGYQVGYDEGFSVGFDEGFSGGFDDGYQSGSNDLSEVFNGSWVDWLGRAITGFFALEIFPNFTLGGAIGSIVVVWLMIWILKVFAGG